jgi:hypothetical protein
MFIVELYNLELWAMNIGNAYLEALTAEKVYIINSPEFCELEDHALVISKALYRLQRSGARWHDRFVDCMSELGFFHVKPNQTSGCVSQRIHMNTLQYMLIT